MKNTHSFSWLPKISRIDNEILFDSLKCLSKDDDIYHFVSTVITSILRTRDDEITDDIHNLIIELINSNYESNIIIAYEILFSLNLSKVNE